MSTRTRRQFLEDSMLAAAAAIAAGSANVVLADSTRPVRDANEKLGAAIVGVNSRGDSHIGGFLGRKEKDVEILYIVDPDEKVGNSRCEQIAKKTGRKPTWVADMRKAFEDKAVDIVSTATPNHWHALTSIWAMQAGKDVYVEKPVSHNVSEGRRMVEVARKHNRICQTGTQSRSNPGMREAMQYMHDGKLGTITLARGLCYKRRKSIGPKGTYQVPAHIDYDLWSGPAPIADLTRKDLHYEWHWQWLYGNGDLGNQGIHQMDLARWGLGVNTLSNAVTSYGGRLGYEDAGETANTQVIVHDYGDKTLVFEVRGLETEDYRGAKVGVIIEGSEGYMVLPSYNAGTVFDKKGNVVQSFKGGDDKHHYNNFIAAVRSGKHEELNADILEGHLSSALCHLGNISYRLGQAVPFAEAKQRAAEIKSTDNAAETFERTVVHLKANNVNLDKNNIQFGQRLTFDPGKEQFVDNSVADAMLTREYRKPFVVPKASEV